VNEGLKGGLHGLSGAIVRPDVCLEAEASFDVYLVLVVKEHHAFSDVSSSFTQPFLREFGEVDKD